MRPLLLFTTMLLFASLCACQSKQGSLSASTPTVEAISVEGMTGQTMILTEPIATLNDIFALSEQDKLQFKQWMGDETDPQLKSQRLMQFIFNLNDSPLQYSSHATYTATQTLNIREANCLSLTILAYALAREVGLHAMFQQVEIPEFWVADGGQSRLSGHVNLILLPSLLATDNYLASARSYSRTRNERARFASKMQWVQQSTAFF